MRPRHHKDDLFAKIMGQHALINIQKKTITLLKRQLALRATVFGKMYEFTS
jgi:hypothetical protein